MSQALTTAPLGSLGANAPSPAQSGNDDTGITGFGGPGFFGIALDTSRPEARRAFRASLLMLGPDGRELTQAEAGIRMALEQRKRAQQGSVHYKAGRLLAARIVLRGAIKRLRKARAVFAPIPVLRPITATVRQLDPAVWSDLDAAGRAAEQDLRSHLVGAVRSVGGR